MLHNKETKIKTNSEANNFVLLKSCFLIISKLKKKNICQTFFELLKRSSHRSVSSKFCENFWNSFICVNLLLKAPNNVEETTLVFLLVILMKNEYKYKNSVNNANGFNFDSKPSLFFLLKTAVHTSFCSKNVSKIRRKEL